MKIVIASDSFKGSMSSLDVATAASAGVIEVYPDSEIVSVNVADGGEGTVEAIVDALEFYAALRLQHKAMWRPKMAVYTALLT